MYKFMYTCFWSSLDEYSIFIVYATNIIYVSMYVCMYIMCTCVYVCMYVCMYVYVYMYACIYVCMYVYIRPQKQKTKK